MKKGEKIDVADRIAKAAADHIKSEIARAIRHGTFVANNTITRVIVDDEIVGRGDVHIERMSDNHVWMSVLGHSFDFFVRGNRLVMWPQDSITDGKTTWKRESDAADRKARKRSKR